MSNTASGMEIPAALIGIAGVVIGGVVAGHFLMSSVKNQNETLLATTKQVIEGEADRGQQEFFRSQRVDAYLDYLSASLALENALERYSHVFARAADRGSLAPVDVVDNDVKLPLLRAAYSEWTVVSHRVRLLSQAAYTAQLPLRDHLESLYGEYVDGQANSLIGTTGRKTNEELRDMYNMPFRQKASDLRMAFSDFVQPELGVIQATND